MVLLHWAHSTGQYSDRNRIGPSVRAVVGIGCVVGVHTPLLIALWGMEVVESVRGMDVMLAISEP